MNPSIPGRHVRKNRFGIREAALIRLSLVASVAAFFALAMHLHFHVEMRLVDRVIYGCLLVGLFYCCTAYQVSRLGASRRAGTHRRFSAVEVERLLAADAPSVAILIPSYREERRVLVMTLLSAALARYSNRRIVLLVDDPPTDRHAVARTLSALDEVRDLLTEPMSLCRDEWRQWRERKTSSVDGAAEGRRISEAYTAVALWLDAMVLRFEREITPEFAHVDRFFVERVLRDLGKLYRRQAEDFFESVLSEDAADWEYAKLSTLFCEDITSFERKRFDNLSHAPNKAMNLNSYIGLMGGAFAVRSKNGRHTIEPVAVGEAPEWNFAAADYVLTLDADSVVLADYILQLGHLLDRNPRFGVVQTPYMSFPNSAEPVERIAGATTDIQYLVHQGATYFNASYWVGANALIRTAALKDIHREQAEGDHYCDVFIQDETVIEDTGSTVDLLRAGWSVHNFFAPLAYSATPGDFGSLAIQRKRWSNGGLIIFPMLLAQYFGSSGKLRRLPELVLRSHYLLSPLIGNAAVFLLMIWSGKDGRALVWTPLVMIPYFLLYGTDLARLGYRLRDLMAVCSLNLMLLPVSFAGIGASLRQMATGRKGSFSRTPKVADRTFVPPYAFVFSCVMLCLMVGYVVDGLALKGYPGTIIPALNVILYSYGLHRFIGFRNGYADVWLALEQRYGAPIARLSRVQDAIVRLAHTPPGRAAISFAMVCFFVLAPWHLGATLSSGDRFHGAPARIDGTAAAEPISLDTLLARRLGLQDRDTLLSSRAAAAPVVDRFPELASPGDLDSWVSPARSTSDLPQLAEPKLPGGSARGGRMTPLVRVSSQTRQDWKSVSYRVVSDVEASTADVASVGRIGAGLSAAEPILAGTGLPGPAEN